MMPCNKNVFAMIALFSFFYKIFILFFSFV